jgi:CheY-like chemotaxis protein
MAGKKKVLVIDDNLDIVENTRIVLESENYEVYGAYDGEQGLAMVKKVNPDLIILDVMMKNLTEGFDVARELRSKAPHPEYADYCAIPILMITSIHEQYNFHFDKDVGTEWLPVDAFIEKPVAPADLLSKVKNMIGPSTA